MKYLSCLAFAAVIGAADWDERHLDLRTELSSLPLSMKQDGSTRLIVGINQFSSSGASTIDAQSAGKFSLLAVGSARNTRQPIGVLGGFGLNFSEWNYRDDDEGDVAKGTLSTATLSAHLGLYAPINNYLRVEFLPWIGSGWSRDEYEWSGPSFAGWSKKKFSHDGTAIEGGVRLSVVASQIRGAQASISVGYMISRSEITSLDYLSVGGSNASIFQDYSVTSQGAFAALSVGIRL